ncbi:hypothetical protein B005_3100 [Nocardiopsis alba ATCC BAA-2165]|uniref:Uncharacterized protein n=1 Tax=Nocardiopsis alba (strain ATCC BAA-2165 / BE74) TaxID=1205910 RepID=J7LEG1_NOCAA|nr:hypothetical protein B005_3100 [Nocardiopsis alba ATCC BAA-2165]
MDPIYPAGETERLSGTRGPSRYRMVFAFDFAFAPFLLM